MNFTSGAVKAHTIERPDAGKALGDIKHFERERSLRQLHPPCHLPY
jgi:hypothetical protein